jgi:hypothetical protein
MQVSSICHIFSCTESLWANITLAGVHLSLSVCVHPGHLPLCSIFSHDFLRTQGRITPFPFWDLESDLCPNETSFLCSVTGSALAASSPARPCFYFKASISFSPAIRQMVQGTLGA